MANEEDRITYGEVQCTVPEKKLEELLKYLMEARQPTIKFVNNLEEMRKQADGIRSFNIEMAIAAVETMLRV